MDQQQKEFDCTTLVIGMTGSVGVVTMHEYVYKFRRFFAKEVHLMMSRSAQRFILPYALQLFSDHPVLTDLFTLMDDIQVPHIELARKADLLLIMPATANILGKAAGGICDDLITTTIVACQAPVVFVPSMNEVMWTDQVVQRNVAILKEVGYYVLDPSDQGVEVSDLSVGGGAMPPFESVLLSLKLILATNRSEE